MIKFGCKKCGYPNVREKSDGRLHCMACGSIFEKNTESKEERDARILYLSRLDDAEKCLRLSPPRFDDAEDLFRDFIKNYPTSGDGYWGLVRARYGIKYEDDISGRQIPSCYKSNYQDFRKDSDFIKALELASCDEMYDSLQDQAKLISGVCKEWREEASKYSYDVFISFKATDDATGKATADSEAMRDLYTYLVEEGYKVFFSPMSMRRYTGKHYDAYIFNALQSAKAMIVYGSKPEYFTTTWVQNEWTRFLRLESKGNKKKGSCVVVYDGFNPKELPHDLRSIQALDAKDKRFYIEVSDCVKSILAEEKTVDPNAELLSQIEEMKRQQAETQRQLEEARKQNSQQSGTLDKKALAEMLRQIEEEKAQTASSDKKNRASTAQLPDSLIECEMCYNKIRTKADGSYECPACGYIHKATRSTTSSAVGQVATSEAKRKTEEEKKAKAEAEAKRKVEAELWKKEGFEIFNGCLTKYIGKSTSVAIPNGVTSIGYEAFKGCSSLKSIEIPGSVTSVGFWAFDGCSSLTSVVIGNSVASIGDHTFSGCSNLASIKIPDSVTSIGQSAFSSCSSLKSIEIPDSVTSIGGSAFSGCSSLTSIEIPGSVTSVGFWAFRGCSSLTSIEIPGSVTSIGDSAFSRCTSLTSIEIPDSVTSIGKSAFSGCSSLTSVAIPNSVTSVGDDAFRDCTDLTNIAIPDSVTSIGDEAFSGCTSLASIEIPNGVTSIGNKAFDGCSSLTSIEIPDSVTSIGDSAFSRCTSLTSIEIPDSVTGIGKSAFDGCSNLASIKISDSVTSIGKSAFSSCSNLASIEIPSSVTSIGDWAFSDCTGLTNIAIPDSVTSICNWAFVGCSNLASIKIPDSVTSICFSAFSCCKSLSIYISNPEQIKKWDKKWNPDNRPVYDAKTGRKLKKNIFGVYK